MIRNTFAIATAVFCTTGWLTEARATDVTVWLASGRSFEAQLDDRSDRSQLWLRFEAPGTTILRPVRWESVEKASLLGEMMDADELRRRTTTAVDADAITRADEVSVAAGDEDGKTVKITVVGEPISAADQARSLLYGLPRLASVTSDAYLANWDADVASDGLILQVHPLDSEGNLRPANGLVTTTLIATKRHTFRAVPHGRGQVPETIGRWTNRVRASDFGNGGVSIKLPFQASHPEWDTDIDTMGLVHIRLVVPGQGVYEHSLDRVRLRPFAPTRDLLERNTGQRFFPGERVGR